MPTIDDYFNEFFDVNFYNQSKHYEQEYRRLQNENNRLKRRVKLSEEVVDLLLKLKKEPLTKEVLQLLDNY